MFNKLNLFSLDVFHKLINESLAAFTALSVSACPPKEIIAHTFSFDGLITSKSEPSKGSTHFPFILNYVLLSIQMYFLTLNILILVILKYASY